MEDIMSRVSALEQHIGHLVENIKIVNQSIAAGFEKVENNFEKTNEKIENLSQHANAGFKHADIQFEDLKSEIRKINEVTGYEGIYTNNLKVLR